jgi:two-component system cell cycle sensor histidine kinase/response regulator CckA
MQNDAKFVLVVDDEAPVLALTSSILEAHGYKVLPALGGINALEQSRGKEVEIMLLLTDVVMPDLNGPHVAELLRAKNPSLRVLFMSGWEPQVISHQGAFRHGWRTLCKPFSASGLIDAVQTALEEPPAADENIETRNQA